MPDGRSTHWGYFLAACLLLAVFLLQGLLASRIKTPVFDEPGDLGAGLSYIQNREVVANPQHPPLLKELAGLSLWLGGVRLPVHPDVPGLLGSHGGEDLVGDATLVRSGPDRVIFLARLPLLLLSTLMGVVIFLWGRQLLGDLAALCALFLYTLDPTMLAHSYLVTLDMGLATFSLVFCWALWNYIRKPGVLRMVLCGVALGFLMAAKFSAVFLLPVAGLLLLAAVLWRDGEDGARLFPRIGGYSGAICAFWTICAVAGLMLPIFYFSLNGWAAYPAGMFRVNADHNPAHLFYFGGELAKQFPGYFVAAWLLKEPIATVLLAILGVALLWKAPLTRVSKLFLLLPPVAIVACHSLLADDLGIRYIIPAMPFGYLLGGLGAAWLMGNRMVWLRVAAGALGVWVVVAAAGIYPDDLSYFNEGACLATHPGWIGLDGGTRCGPSWMDDSNVDWGQGLKQLRDWLMQHPTRDADPKVRIAFLGMVPPVVYGVSCDHVMAEQLMDGPAPGRTVVSSHVMANVFAWAKRIKPGGADWLKRKPTAVVAHVWYIFDLEP